MSGAISEHTDADTQARHAGALGDVDLEHIYPPVGSCITVQPPLGDVVARQGQEIAALQFEVSALRGHVAHLIDYLRRGGTIPL
jgi:hypothetical protein